MQATKPATFINMFLVLFLQQTIQYCFGHSFYVNNSCRLYAYEGVGMLLGQEELAAEEQHAYIAALLRPLIQQVCPHVLVP